MSDPVDTLLSVHEGQTVSIEARYYDYTTPYRVEAIEETRWKSPVGSVWRSRRVSLAPTDPRSSTKTLDVADDSPPPSLGRGVGPLESVEVADPAPGPTDELELPEWLDRDPRDLVRASPVKRDLGEILDEVERHDLVIDIHRRLGSNTLTRTRKLLGGLGLLNSAGRLHDEETVAERIQWLRRQCVGVDDE